jgi:hypothetical protein
MPGLRAIESEFNSSGLGDALWNPDTAATVSGLVEQKPTADGTYRMVMFDLGAPDAVTVYLEASRD